MSRPDFLLDTNVLIYAIDVNSDFHQRSRDFISGSEGVPATTSICLAEAYSVLTRKNGYHMNTSDVLEIIRWFRNNLTILYPNADSSNWLHYFIRTYNPVGHHIFDMEIAAIGLAHNLNKIATKNVKDFRKMAEMSPFW